LLGVEKLLNKEALLLLKEIKTFFQEGTVLYECAERFESMAAAEIPPSKDCWLALCQQIQKEIDKLDKSMDQYHAGVALGVLLHSNKAANAHLANARKLRSP
jgi:hypothetical protein